MNNIIRADIYRIIRGKGLYITLAVFLAVIILQVVGNANMGDGIQRGEFVVIEKSAINTAEAPNRPYGAEAPYLVMSFTSGFLFILLPLLVFISSTEFTSGAVKNILTRNVSRNEFYISKLILSCITCILLFLVYVLLSSFIATILTGFGSSFTVEYILRVIKVFSIQLWLCLAMTCIGHFFIFSIRSKAAITAYIAFLLTPSIIINLISPDNRLSEVFLKYDFALMLNNTVYANTMSATDIAIIIFIGGIYIVFASVVGCILFRSAEIK